MLTRSIDLNADIGEHDGDKYAGDSAILDVISSANIACGAHAGSVEVMRRTTRLAADKGIVVGAHPGYPDREGFGRRELGLSPVKIRKSFDEQLAAMSECCAVEKVKLSYVKPHGALYNRASRDKELAEMLAEAISEFDSTLFVLALSGSELERAAHMFDLRVAREAFIDRAYTDDGSLVPRDRDGAVIHDSNVAAERAVTMMIEGRIQSIDGNRVDVTADSLCVHGDSTNAFETVRLARARLEKAGFEIRAFAAR